jgi:hypothetical protein
MKTSHVALWAVLFATGETFAQTSPDNMQCVTEIEVPRYSWVARGAIHDTGTVTIDLRIGRSGAMEDIQTKGPDQRLIKEVTSFLEAGAKFSPSCEGKRVQMLFTFRMEGEPTHYPFTRFTFRPPNHFIVTSQRTFPTVDYLPVPPHDSKQPKK